MYTMCRSYSSRCSYTPMTTRCWLLSALFLAVAPVVIRAQTGTTTVHGVVFDSLHDAPLERATVMLSGTNRMAVTDGRGRFTFDSVSPGTHTYIAYHAAIDSLGLGALSATASANETADVRLAIPSFATLWRAACGAVRAASDSGFVYGRVYDAAAQRPLQAAQVTVSWTDLQIDSAKKVHQKRWSVQTRTDASGAYGVCGVPISTVPEIVANTDSTSSGVLDMPGTGVRVRRRDLYLGSTSGASLGTLAGIVTNEGNSPVANARVLVDNLPEVRTDAKGRFAVHDVPSGSREVQVLSVGMTPATVVADVTPRGTTTVRIEIRKLTTLEAVRVIGSAKERFVIQGFADRKRQGLGHFADSTVISRAPTIAAALTSFPSVTMQRAPRTNSFVLLLPQGVRLCQANLFVDGVRQVSYDILDDLHPDQIAAVEIYRDGSLTPNEFQVAWSSCGAVAVWTKMAFNR